MTTRGGRSLECSEGPEGIDYKNPSPAIKLTRLEGDTHFIFEERITYPSFMYSVWKVDTTNKQQDRVEPCFPYIVKCAACGGGGDGDCA